MLYYGCIPKLSFLVCLICNDTRGGGGVVVVGLLPIMIPPQQKLFQVVLGCWLGCGNKRENKQKEIKYN
jgi:hypothetical protein